MRKFLRENAIGSVSAFILFREAKNENEKNNKMRENGDTITPHTHTRVFMQNQQSPRISVACDFVHAAQHVYLFSFHSPILIFF